MKTFFLIFGLLLLSAGNVTGSPVYSRPVSSGISDMTREVVEIVNMERSKAGLDPLTADASLMASAHLRAEELQKKFDHERPGGDGFHTVIEIPYRSAGENIAYGQLTAAEVMKDWMGSKGHRRNILSTDFTHIGVGCYERLQTVYWVQLFIKKPS